MKKLILFILFITLQFTSYSQYSSNGYHTISLDSSSFATIAASFGKAGIVGLGESTHWSKEMTKFNTEFIKYLMVNTEYRVLVLEENFYECSQINSYLQTGEGNIDALYKQLMGVWQSPAFLDILKWMRAHNAQQSGENRKVALYGADMQRGSAVPHLSSYAAVHGGGASFQYLGKLAETGLNLKNQPKDVKAGIAAELVTLEDLLKEKGKANLSQAQQEDHVVMLQQFETLKQYYENETAGVLKWVSFRDRKMAENVAWVRDKEQPKGNKVLVWAHSGHLRNSNLKMGNYLKQSNPDYFILAQDFISGHTKSNKQRELHYPISEHQPLLGNYFLKKEGSMFFANFQDAGFLKSYFAQFMRKNPLVQNEGVTKGTLKVKPGKQFDAIIIHRTTSPKY